MQKMIDLGRVYVFPLDIVAVEKGRWDDHSQEWKAVVVASGGARIETGLFVKEVVSILEKARLTQK